MIRATRSAWRAAWMVAMLVVGPGATPAPAQTPDGDLARKVANPLASLISVPFQYNHDEGIGPFDSGRSTLNVQPVVPFAPGGGAHWRLISRTVAPFVEADGGPFGGDPSGAGDVTQSVFVMPAAPTDGGWTLGAGPVMQFPTGSSARLTSGRWSAGPTAIAVRQVGPWVYGALVNHLWSIAGDDDRADVSTTFAQPFVNYVTRTHTTFALNTEATRDWEADTWSVPVHVIVNQLVKVGPMPVSVFAGARWWAVTPDQGPEGWGLRFGSTLLFPTVHRAGAIRG